MKTFTLATLMIFSVLGHSFAGGACGGTGTEKDSAHISSDDKKDQDSKDLRNSNGEEN